MYKHIVVLSRLYDGEWYDWDRGGGRSRGRIENWIRGAHYSIFISSNPPSVIYKRIPVNTRCVMTFLRGKSPEEAFYAT